MQKAEAKNRCRSGCSCNQKRCSRNKYVIGKGGSAYVTKDDRAFEDDFLAKKTQTQSVVYSVALVVIATNN